MLRSCCRYYYNKVTGESTWERPAALGTGARTVAPKTQKKARKPLPLPGKKERMALFDRFDFNGNGLLSLAEIDKAVVELYPHFDHKPALMRAYHAADVTGDGWIGRREFRLLLKYLTYFNDLWHKFEEVDVSHDRRISPDEFAHGCRAIGLELSSTEAYEEFRDLDQNGGGFVLFDEFCSWAARRHIGMEEGQEEENAELQREEEEQRQEQHRQRELLQAQQLQQQLQLQQALQGRKQEEEQELISPVQESGMPLEVQRPVLDEEGAVEGTPWAVYYDDDHVPYYFNVSTSQTVWEEPPEVRARRLAGATLARACASIRVAIVCSFTTKTA